MRRLTILLLAFTLTAAHGADLAREARLADEIVDAIIEGEPLWLEAGGHRFLGILTEPSNTPKGAVVILHGRGFHPDWEAAVQPLRTGLAERGWVTLALQMPVLEKDAKYYDYEPIFPEAMPRIEAALAELRERGHAKPILIAHSCGAHMAMHWIRERGDDALGGYAGIGMGATDFQQPMRRPFPLDAMKVPVLDVYAGNDYSAVLRQAPQRWAAITKAGNPKSSQRVIEKADHYMTHHGSELTDAVATWLETLQVK